MERLKKDVIVRIWVENERWRENERGVYDCANIHFPACQPEIEAFDAKLAHRIQFLATEIEAETLALANLRRTAPAATAAEFHDAFTRAAERDNARLRSSVEARVQSASETKLDVDEIARLDEVRRSWQSGAESLGHLDGDMKATVARLEKAKTVADALKE